MNLNGVDPNLPASGVEDRGHGRNEMDHFDRTGDFPAACNCVGNGAWAATDQGIFDRHCGALAGAMTVDAAITGCCERADSQTPVLGVAVPYAVGNVLLTILGPVIVTLTSVA